MSIVTLTTDLGYRDPYLAIVKAKLISANLNTTIIDLSCDIKDNTIADAAFILKNALPYFPKNTIHLVAVKFIVDSSGNNKSQTIENTRYLVSYYKNQYIICPDNGLFTLIDKEFSEPVYQIFYEDNSKHHFFLKDIFVDVANHLLQNNDLQSISSLTNDYYKATQYECYVNGNFLRGKSIYIDDFGNIITNVTKQQFVNIVGKKKFIIALPGKRIDEISNTYDEVKIGDPLALFNSFGYLEIAVNGKSAYNMLCPRDIGNRLDFDLIIEFYD